MYFIEKIGNKYFVTLAHATSLSNLHDIENFGLKPITVNIQLIESYIKKLLPKEDEKALAASILNHESPEAFLIHSRLNQSPRICFLPVTNIQYLKGAAKNSINDKGELYKAIRLTLTQVLNKPIDEPCLNDKSIIITTRMQTFPTSNDEFEIRNPHNVSVDEKFNKYTDSSEIKISWIIPYNDLRVYEDFQKFFDTNKTSVNF